MSFSAGLRRDTFDKQILDLQIKGHEKLKLEYRQNRKIFLNAPLYYNYAKHNFNITKSTAPDIF